MENLLKSNVLYVLDPLCRGYEHSQINGDYLSVLSHGNEFDKIVFFAEKEHLKSLYIVDYLDQNIIFHPISISLTHRLSVIVANILVLLRIFLISRKSKYPLLIFSCNKFLFIIIRFCSLITQKSFVLFLHNFIFELDNKRKYFFSLRFMFKFFNNSKIKYVVFGDFVQGNLLSILPQLRKNLYSIDLIIKENISFDLNSLKRTETNRIERIYTIGSAGVFSGSKGSFYFLKLISDLNEIPLFRFKYAGFIENSILKKFMIKESAFGNPIRSLSNIEYNQIFSSFDFLILFYPKSSYRLGFSGIFLDLLKYEVPLIALRNDFFDFYFLKYGKLGWLFEDYDSLLNHLLSMNNFTFENEINFFKSNIRMAKKDFYYSKVYSKLMSVLK